MQAIMKVQKDTTSYLYSLSTLIFLLSFAFAEEVLPHFFFQLFHKKAQQETSLNDKKEISQIFFWTPEQNPSFFSFCKLRLSSLVLKHIFSSFLQ